MANISLKDIQFPGLNNVYKVPEVDNTLTQSGAAADAKKTGDELSDLKQDLEGLDVYTLGLYPQMSVADTAVASFTDGADDIPVKSLTVDIEPVQSGSGDPSPENIRPISGWTWANVSVFDVNLWNEEWELGAINDSGVKTVSTANFRSKNYISVQPNATYTIYYGSYTTSTILYYYFYDSNKEYVGVSDYIRGSYGSFTVPSNACYMLFRTGGVSPQNSYNHDISINYPSTETTYHAYKGNVYSISFPAEAGTVYGGTLDVTSGVLTVERTIISRAWGEWGASGTLTNNTRKMLILSNKCATGASSSANKACNLTPYFGNYTTDTPHFYVESENVFVFLPNDTASDVVVQVVYPLLVPWTYQLTPTEVATILGQNNIFCDTGNINELTYRADLKAYIDEKLA